MKSKTYIGIDVALELSEMGYIKNVWIDRKGEHGGILNFYMTNNEYFYYVYRLYSEAQDDYKRFSSKIRISRKAGIEFHNKLIKTIQLENYLLENKLTTKTIFTKLKNEPTIIIGHGICKSALKQKYIWIAKYDEIINRDKIMNHCKSIFDILINVKDIISFKYDDDNLIQFNNDDSFEFESYYNGSSVLTDNLTIADDKMIQFYNNTFAKIKNQDKE